VLDPEGALGKLIGDATDVAERFIGAAEKFVAAVLQADGWKLREVDPTKI
jgi:hypothetical protein